MDLGLKGRSVVVTGGSGGIGRAITAAFGREGARVAITFRVNESGAEEAAARVRAEGGEAMTSGLSSVTSPPISCACWPVPRTERR